MTGLSRRDNIFIENEARKLIPCLMGTKYWYALFTLCITYVSSPGAGDVFLGVAFSINISSLKGR